MRVLLHLALGSQSAHHSPSCVLSPQSQGSVMISCLPLGKCFCENISNHVLSRTINYVKGTALDSVLDKMILDVNMFCPCMIVVILDKFYGSLIIVI